MKHLGVLGSTGSIGTATLKVAESFPEHFRIAALAAGKNTDLVRQQAERHRPALVCVADRSDALTLSSELPFCRVVWGEEGLEETACYHKVDLVVAALVGSIGLAPNLSAIRAGKDLVLANKETLVAAGELIMAEVAERGVQLLPVDSEHNAIHQCLQGDRKNGAKRLILTASGGPFRTWSGEEIERATVADALAHPTWEMGRKISVDSATMMNKGLEIIEAHHLFNVPEECIDIVVHPQSIVHSLVEYVDGTQIAQLAVNDMRLPILYALSWPKRLPNRIPVLNLTETPPLSFEPIDSVRFPAPGLARAALRAGGEMPAVLNAANEIAVDAFLDRRCPFPAIAATVESVLNLWPSNSRHLETLEQVLAADNEARRLAVGIVAKYQYGQNCSEKR